MNFISYFLILFLHLCFIIFFHIFLIIIQNLILRDNYVGGGGDSGYKKLSTVNRRMFIMTAAKLVIFGGIITRLFSLQINENKKYLTLSDKNRLRDGDCHLSEEILKIFWKKNCQQSKSLSITCGT